MANPPLPTSQQNKAGGPPPGDFRDWDQKDWFAAYITPQNILMDGGLFPGTL
jgi:hypothetical protein